MVSFSAFGGTIAWSLIAKSKGEKLSAAAVQNYRAGMTADQIKAAEPEAARFKPHRAIVKQ